MYNRSLNLMLKERSFYPYLVFWRLSCLHQRKYLFHIVSTYLLSQNDLHVGISELNISGQYGTKIDLLETLLHSDYHLVETFGV